MCVRMQRYKKVLSEKRFLQDYMKESVLVGKFWKDRASINKKKCILRVQNTLFRTNLLKEL